MSINVWTKMKCDSNAMITLGLDIVRNCQRTISTGEFNQSPMNRWRFETVIAVVLGRPTEDLEVVIDRDLDQARLSVASP